MTDDFRPTAYVFKTIEKLEKNPPDFIEYSTDVTGYDTW